MVMHRVVPGEGGVPPPLPHSPPPTHAKKFAFFAASRSGAIAPDRPWAAKSQMFLSCVGEGNVTGKSYIVDIRKIKDARTAADYAAKYASKPAELRFLPMSYRQQMIEATRNVRTYGTWGVVKKQKLFAKSAYNKEDWETLGSWLTVSSLMKHDADAAAIWNAWQTGEPLSQGISVAYIDTFIQSPSGIPPNPVNQIAENPRLF